MRFRSVLVFLGCALVCVPTASVPAAGLDLAWSACAGDGGTHNRDFACDSDAGAEVLVASFTLDQPAPGVSGIQGVLDLIAADHAVVPAWWEFFHCHLGGLTASAAIPPGAFYCADWSAGSAFAGLAGYDHSGIISNADSASHRRVKMISAMGQPGATLNANQEYFAFNVAIDHQHTTGAGACAGCAVPVCLVLNSLQLLDGTGTVQLLSSGRAAGSNFATWQGGAGADCAAVPVRRVTWGQVKSVYR